MIPRLLLPKLRNSSKSILLLGPRQTGKSTLMRSLEPELSINLIHEPTFLDFASNPKELDQRLEAQRPKTILIDEVQRLPSILNTVQHIIDETSHPPKFYLTGSSARKLKRGRANLLPGRVLTYHFGPLAASELGYNVTDSCLSYGTLPEIYTEPDQEQKQKILRSYTGTYLKEEIQAEALTQNIEGFSRFLSIAAGDCTKHLDLTKLARQAQVERHSAVRWFEILEDTLIVWRIPPYAKSTRTRLVQHPKFFFFDNGVLCALLKDFSAAADRKGMLFENLFCSQLMASSFTADKDIEVSSFRTEHGAEIDLIVDVGGETWAIECKSSEHLSKVNARAFKSFSEFKKDFRPAVAYLGKTKKVIDGITVYPWAELLREMGL